METKNLLTLFIVLTVIFIFVSILLIIFVIYFYIDYNNSKNNISQSLISFKASYKNEITNINKDLTNIKNKITELENKSNIIGMYTVTTSTTNRNTKIFMDDTNYYDPKNVYNSDTGIFDLSQFGNKGYCRIDFNMKYSTSVYELSLMDENDNIISSDYCSNSNNGSVYNYIYQYTNYFIIDLSKNQKFYIYYVFNPILNNKESYVNMFNVVITNLN